MNQFYKNKKVLITGHTGFKGSWLTQILLNWGAEVVGISLKPDTTPSLFEVLGLESKIKNYFVDVRNFSEVQKIFRDEKPEIVFHLAAQPIVRVSYDDPLRTISTNTLGTAHVLQVIHELGTVKSVVIITTDKVYEDKDWLYPYRENDSLGGYDPYSASKAAADIITKSYLQSFFNPKDFKIKHNTLITIARAGNVIGGGDWAPYRLVPDIIRSIYDKKEAVEIRSPQAVRPWEHVLEPLSGYLRLGKNLYEEDTVMCQAWNFGPNDESFMCVEELAKRAVGILGSGSVNIKPDGSKHETNILKLDVTKAKTLLGWRPVLNFEQNLEYTFSWYKNYYDKKEDVVVFTNKQINNFFKN
ncbi:CDP-glucose 4,6-dehydratase [Candidatus Gracilibacteria bacterium]|nr:CDP-glucose 4,6-dehydratase [Candidatus Gracilibacteria bacterium]MCF7898666.1 CDP-glucose 4,6-dehydratase [Candidatus Paceibacterota bacterium]